MSHFINELILFSVHFIVYLFFFLCHLFIYSFLILAVLALHSCPYVLASLSLCGDYRF